MHIARQPRRIRSLVLALSCLLLAGCALPPMHTTPTQTNTRFAWANTRLAPTIPTYTPETLGVPKQTPKAYSIGTPVAVAGELHLAVREDVKTLNPYLALNASEEFVVSLLYDTLLDDDLRSGLQPNLAERWELAADGVNLICWLNPQARWHNGQPVTAQDVAFSFNLVRQKQFPGFVRIAALVDRVEAVSLREVKFVLLAKRADAVRLLGTKLRIVPAELWEKVGDPLQDANLDNPIGSGPFLLLERGEGKQLVLRNTRVHHCTRPSIETLVLEILRDEDKALRALKDGKLDGLGWDIAPELASKVHDDPDSYTGIKLLEAPGTSTQILLINLRKAPYDNRAFRQALALAIDTQAIVDAVLIGFGDTVSLGLFPPASPWRNPNVTPIAFEPQQAMQTLETAGFLDRNSDGLRESLDGSALQIPLVCADLPSPLQVAELVATDWQAVGIATKVTAMPQDRVMPTLMQAQFDIALQSTLLNEPEMALSYFHTSRGLLRNGRVSGFNYGGYADPEYDELVSAAQQEQNAARQQELLYQLQDILATDVPQIPLYIPRVLNLYRDDRFVGWSAEAGIGLLSRTTIVHLRTR